VIEILTLIALFLLIGMVLGLLFKKMAPGSADGLTVQSADYSPDDYRPMLRLLDEPDDRFIAAHPAFGPKKTREMRAERRQIFRGYLRRLRADYGRICLSIRTLIVESDVDRPDLVKALMRSQILFAVAVFGVEWRLVLHTMGTGTVDVRNLVAALEAMRGQWQSLASVQPVTA
jgi:hypothetical protein